MTKTCKEMSVVCKNARKLARSVMGHNWIHMKTSHVAGINSDGMRAGLDKQHIKPGDTLVIAATKVLDPVDPENLKIAVNILVAGQECKFSCAFPGNRGITKGTFSVANQRSRPANNRQRSNRPGSVKNVTLVRSGGAFLVCC
jgi:azurin